MKVKAPYPIKDDGTTTVAELMELLRAFNPASTVALCDEELRVFELPEGRTHIVGETQPRKRMGTIDWEAAYMKLQRKVQHGCANFNCPTCDVRIDC